MDLKQEIINHLEWIDAIASLLGKEDMTEDDLQAISQHDRCELGQWLESDAAASLRDFADFDPLVDSHNRFHELAGRLITGLQDGDEAAAIQAQQQFIEMSKQVVGYLQALDEQSGGA